VRGFVIPTTTKGFRARNIERKLSLRASVTSELMLEDCRLPASAMLPGVEGMRGPLSCLSEARYGIVWGALGAARACYEAALEYAKTRIQFGKPIAGFQLTQEKLVNMALELQKGQLLARKLGRLKDAGTLSAAARQHRQAQQRARGARDLPRSAHDPGRKRRHARVSGHPPHEQSRIGPDLRRHERNSHADPGSSDHRNRRVHLARQKRRGRTPRIARAALFSFSIL
jgi:alkylation response protein AidB-like acyl-CoA dehydrogenase